MLLNINVTFNIFLLLYTHLPIRIPTPQYRFKRFQISLTHTDVSIVGNIINDFSYNFS